MRRPMSKGRWAITAGLAVVSVACVLLTVTANNHRANAEDRQDADEEQLLETASELEDLQADVNARTDAQADLQTRADTLDAIFRPDVLSAIVQVQADTSDGACASARTATRDATAPPTGDSVVAFAVATAPSGHAELDGLPGQWGRMLDSAAVQAEIDRCAADEQAIIDAEAAAAAAAAAATARQAAADAPIGYAQCLADFPDTPGLCADTDGNGYAGPFQPGADI